MREGFVFTLQYTDLQQTAIRVRSLMDEFKHVTLLYGEGSSFLFVTDI
jgi:hypothetical protein